MHQSAQSSPDSVAKQPILVCKKHIPAITRLARFFAAEKNNWNEFKLERVTI